MCCKRASYVSFCLGAFGPILGRRASDAAELTNPFHTSNLRSRPQRQGVGVFADKVSLLTSKAARRRWPNLLWMGGSCLE